VASVPCLPLLSLPLCAVFRGISRQKIYDPICLIHGLPRLLTGNSWTLRTMVPPAFLARSHSENRPRIAPGDLFVRRRRLAHDRTAFGRQRHAQQCAAATAAAAARPLTARLQTRPRGKDITSARSLLPSPAAHAHSSSQASVQSHFGATDGGNVLLVSQKEYVLACLQTERSPKLSHEKRTPFG